MIKTKILIVNPNLISTVLLILISCILNGCTSHEYRSENISNQQKQWMQSIVNYKNTVNYDDNGFIKTPNSLISDEMRSIVLDKFSHMNKSEASANLARWLMSSDGHDMEYDLAADLYPIDSFNQKRGNCLSFTILLVNLADVLDIKLDYNDVHLPNTWGLDTEQQGLILFRHINAVRSNKDRTEIYDLAIEEYDYGYPQRIISEKEAIASLHSNLATQSIQTKDYLTALHHIKYAISSFPNNPDFWVNLGVVYKKSGHDLNAENAFLHALNLKDSDSLAASNLEKIYRKQNKTAKADYFKKIAHRARQKNPYMHYNLAQKYVKEKRFNLAKKSINKAKKLHNQDSRFYVLSSIIAQHNNDFISATKDIQTAYSLTVSAQDRKYFSKKARLLAVKAIKNSRSSQAIQDSILNDSGLFDSTND